MSIDMCLTLVFKEFQFILHCSLTVQDELILVLRDFNLFYIHLNNVL